jgi:hypothetical protein
MHNKVRLADSDLGPVVLSIFILKKYLLERGKLWKSVKNVDFHMILPIKKMIIKNTCNYLNNALL